MYGIMCLGSFLPVLDLAHSDPMLLLRNRARVESALSICGKGFFESPLLSLDSLHSGFTMPLKSHVHTGSVLLVFGVTCSDFLILALDFVAMGSSLFLRSFI